MVMLLLFTEELVTQLNEDVSVQFTTSPLLNVDELYVLLLNPTGEPFRYHWYPGDPPPFVDVAVNVTEVPIQIDVVEAEIETVGVTGERTLMLMVLLVAVCPGTQGALLVIIQ